MKKVITFVPALLILCLFLSLFTLPVGAADPPRLVDDANLLTAGEAAELEAKLNRYSENYGMDIAVVTTYEYLGYDVEAYAEDLYLQYGYSGDGVLLLIGMADRDWVITACGDEGKKIFNEDAREYISDSFYSALHNGCYADAFGTFADLCRDLIGNAVTRGEYYKTPFNWFGSLIAGLVVGLIIAAIYVGKLKNDLISVAAQENAALYVARDSLNITEARETFLYRNITKTPIPQSSSSSSSRSSGSSHSSFSSSHGKF